MADTLTVAVLVGVTWWSAGQRPINPGLHQRLLATTADAGKLQSSPSNSHAISSNGVTLAGTDAAVRGAAQGATGSPIVPVAYQPAKAR